MKSNSVGLADIRDTNRKIVLRTVWRLQPVSRADVSRQTRINKASISSIVAGLIEEGLVREDRSDTTQIGRTPLALTINDEGRSFLAIDVRRGAATTALYDLSGHRLDTEPVQDTTRGSSPDRILKRISASLHLLCERNMVPHTEVHAIGMAVPGAVSHETGHVIRATTMDWRNVDVRTPVCAGFPAGTAFVVDNSANLAFRAELFRGHSLHDTFTGVYVDINEGIESGVMLDGKLVGYNNMGSYGRMQIANGAGRQPVRWEQVAAVPALLQQAEQHPGRRKDPRAALLRVKEAYLSGDEMTRQSVAEYADWLALGISNVFLSLGLPTIVVGGHIRAIWDLLQERVFMRCEELTHGAFPIHHQIRLSSLTDLETLEGAALAAIGTIIPLDLISQLTNSQKQIIESKVARR